MMTQPDAKHLVIRASAAGAKLNAHLRHGGGSDDTAALQRVLDTANTGRPVHLIIDGPALVSGLNLYSNTIVECTEGGGLFLADGSDRAILRNANRSREAIRDRNITVRRCFLNGNRKGQQAEAGPFQSQHSRNEYYHSTKQEKDGTFKSGLQFFGVDGLVLQDLTIFNAKAFGSWIANASNINLRRVRVDSGFPPFPDGLSLSEREAFLHEVGSIDDGLHFSGPIKHLTLNDIELRTIDDGIALNANNMGVDDVTAMNDMGPYVGQGPITDVRIRNVRFMDSLHGVRILSRTERIDRISLSRLTGTIRHRGFLISPYIDRNGTGARGDIGTIKFSDIEIVARPFVRLAKEMPEFLERTRSFSPSWDAGEEGDVPVISVNARIKRLTIMKASAHLFDDRPTVRIGKLAAIDRMAVDLVVKARKDSTTVPLQMSGGFVRNLMARITD